MRKEAIRIIKQLIGCAIIAGLIWLFWWWRTHDAYALRREITMEDADAYDYKPAPTQK